MTLTDSTVSGNSARYHGGGGVNNFGTLLPPECGKTSQAPQSVER